MSVKARKMLSLCGGLLLLIYVGYQVFQFNKRDIETEVATYATVSEGFQARAFVLRDEEPVLDSYSGILNYSIQDGSRVAQGGTIAEIFQNESDATAKSKIERLNTEIEMLDSLSGPSDYVANPDLLTKQIATAAEGLLRTVRTGDYALLNQRRDAFQKALNQRSIILGSEKVEDYDARIEELKQERDAIAGAAHDRIGFITSPAAGYFISAIDGYEEQVSTADVDDLTTADIDKLFDMQPGAVHTAAIGKICKQFDWYLVCKVKEEDMIKLQDLETVEIEVPFATTARIPATIHARNRNMETGETALVLSCTYMDTDLARIRDETIKVNARTYSGVLVNEKSIFFNTIETTETAEDGTVQTVRHEKVKGVYIKKGERLEFVQIFSDKTINGYAICRTELTEEDYENLVTDSTIHQYDHVVVGGADLYDGKLV